MEIYNSKIFWDIHQNYEKQSYRNRTFIHSANGVLKLTVPIKHSINKFSLKDSIIDNSIKWQDNHWKSIKTAYSFILVSISNNLEGSPSKLNKI